VPVIDVVWDHSYDAASMLRELAVRHHGLDPGPLHHLCPACGSVTHGQPSFDAPVAVSIARAGGLTVVALGPAGSLGVDVAVAAPDVSSWTRTEAVAKAHGTGIVVEHDLDADGTWIADLELPAGFVGAVAVVGLSRPPEVRAAPARTARR
jgi:hypothetical protein